MNELPTARTTQNNGCTLEVWCNDCLNRVQAMREKGLHLRAGELRADMARRILWTLNRMLPRGAVVKRGKGAGAEWTLPNAAIANRSTLIV